MNYLFLFFDFILQRLQMLNNIRIWIMLCFWMNFCHYRYHVSMISSMSFLQLCGLESLHECFDMPSKKEGLFAYIDYLLFCIFLIFFQYLYFFIACSLINVKLTWHFLFCLKLNVILLYSLFFSYSFTLFFHLLFHFFEIVAKLIALILVIIHMQG